jgi:hypothetical protein
LWDFVTREQAPRPGQRQRTEVLETAAEQDETIEGLAEAELIDLDVQPADQLRMTPLTAQTRITSLFSGTALLGLMTMRSVVQDQPPAQTQPWWQSFRG